MVMSVTDVKQKLIRENVEFKRLYDRHQDYEKRLDVLHGHVYLTSDEEREMAELKKHKLHLKDQMQILIEKFRSDNA